MSRRIEIELTSKVDDETWTWRAAGAKQPKGRVAAKLLPDGAKVSDVLRAEVEDDLDGIGVLAILPPKEKAPEPERIQILPPVERKPPPPPSSDERSKRPGPAGKGRAAPPSRDRPERGRPDRGRPDRDRPDRDRPDRRAPRAARPRPEPPPERPKPKRLSPGHAHRQAVLESLPPEQRAIAEQVLRGGIPAVRQAIDTQNAQLKADKQSAIKAEPLIVLAEELLPRLKAAEWLDRAEAAARLPDDDLSLRDLRSVVGSAEAARDDDARLLARTLRETLDRRLKLERDAWVGEIGDAITGGRVVRALRIASRPPDPAMRFPADVGARLAESASGAMDADAPPDRWLAVLDALSVSPVRRAAKPAALPRDASDELIATAKQAATRVPGLGPLVGIEPPAPPPPPGAPRRPPPPPPRPPGALPQRRPPGAAAPDSATTPASAETPDNGQQPEQVDASAEKAEETLPTADT